MKWLRPGACPPELSWEAERELATSNIIASAQGLATGFRGALTEPEQRRLTPTPGRATGCFLEDVTFTLGSQSTKSSFPGRGQGKGYPGRAYVQRHPVWGDQVWPGNGRWFSAYSLRRGVASVGAVEKWSRTGGWGPWFWVYRVWPAFCTLWGAKQILARGLTQSTIRSLGWLCGRWTGESQTGDKEGSCYELYLEGSRSPKVPGDPPV